jgi:branched-chain amino acid transport system permease protein
VDLYIAAAVSGVLLGAVYALIASGLNLIFGVMRVLNFAHGDFLMLAAFTTYWLHKLVALDPLRSLLIVIPLFFVLGIVVYYVTVPRLLKAAQPQRTSFILFFGVSLMISGAASAIWGADTRGIPFPYGVAFLKAGPITLPIGRLLAFAVAFVAALSLLYLLYRTYTGKALRAIIQNRDAVQLFGVNPHRLSAMAFGIGVLLTGIAGTIIVLVFPAVTPDMGIDYSVIAFVAVVLGGLGSPVGGLVGGFLIAFVESMSQTVLPPAFGPLVIMVILVSILWVRPQGLVPRG